MFNSEKLRQKITTELKQLFLNRGYFSSKIMITSAVKISIAVTSEVALSKVTKIYKQNTSVQ